ncbi:HD-GYP domain-containing protein [Parahaliea maris]|uniref:HD-GYP domain-containing protein n=1 Tax=Parahaliea maris TaxID=2716870 RepID=UPI00164F34CC|nr:HD domain-containing phosphohydrolase [Parahaliea maris]
MDDNKKARAGLSVPLGLVLTLLAVGAVLVTAAAITGINYYLDARHGERAAADEFVSISMRSADAVNQLERKGESLALALSEYEFSERLFTKGEGHGLLSAMARLLHRDDAIFSLFAGFPGGDYLELSNLDASSGLRGAWGARPEERWVLMRIHDRDGVRSEVRQFLGPDLAVLREEVRDSDYFANQRPWFQGAERGRLHVTDPYQLDIVQRRGMSYSVAAGEGVVVGAVVLLSSLDAALGASRYPQTQMSLLFNQAGQLIASSRPPEGAAEVTRVRDEISAAQPHRFLVELAAEPAGIRRLREVSLAEHSYFAYVEPLQGLDADAGTRFAGFLVSVEEVMARYRRQALISVLISVGMVVLVLPLVFLATRAVSEPIRRLAAESDKVRQRDYENVHRVPSAIREVSWLSKSLVEMSDAICSYEEQQRALREGIIKLIAGAVDRKSPYTGGHCERVPVLAESLASAASAADSGPLADFSLSGDAAWREFRIAAWLHDCGKITTPEHIVDKGAKLEANYNRIHEIRMRFEVLLRDAEIAFLRKAPLGGQGEVMDEAGLKRRCDEIADDFAFLARCNIGGEFMDDAHIERLRRIGALTWERRLDDRLGLSPVEAARLAAIPSPTPGTETVLADKPEHCIPWDHIGPRLDTGRFTMQPPPLKQNLGELYNLSIGRGTLTDEDRYRINEHISATIDMLEALPWPEELSRVAEYAGGHHEKMDGTGYPRSLRGDQLSIPARILAIADIFEALTAGDRPYKPAKKLSVSMSILRSLALEQHIDKDLFRLFVEQGLYRDYARDFLRPDQIDDVDAEALLAGV